MYHAKLVRARRQVLNPRLVDYRHDIGRVCISTRLEVGLDANLDLASLTLDFAS
jgi:hypothetical protein